MFLLDRQETDVYQTVIKTKTIPPALLAKVFKYEVRRENKS